MNNKKLLEQLFAAALTGNDMLAAANNAVQSNRGDWNGTVTDVLNQFTANSPIAKMSANNANNMFNTLNQMPDASKNLNSFTNNVEALANQDIDVGDLGINAFIKNLTNANIGNDENRWIHDPNYGEVRSGGEDYILEPVDFSGFGQDVRNATLAGIGNAINKGTAKNQKLINWFNKVNLK